jgi:hypothetical protein
LNGKGVAHFSANHLQDAAGSKLGNYIAVASYRVVILLKSTVNSAPSGDPTTDPGVLSDSVHGDWGISINNTNVTLQHVQLDATTKTAAKAITANAWHMVDASYDGSNISISVDAGTAATTAATSLFNSGGLILGDPLFVGTNYTGVANYAGDVAEILIANTALAQISSAEFKAYFNSRYALSL